MTSIIQKIPFVVAMVCALLVCELHAQNPTQSPAKSYWRVREFDLGEPYSEYTIAIGVGRDAIALHGKTITVIDENWGTTSPKLKLPFPTAENTAAVYDGTGGFVYGDGNRKDIYHIDIKTWTIKRLPDIEGVADRAFRLCIDDRGSVIRTSGGKWLPVTMFKLVGDQWVPQAEIITVNPLGKFSRGLYPVPGGLYAFGDHHIGYYNRLQNKWRKKSNIVGFMGLRPSIFEGGMTTQDPWTHNIYATAGKNSKSFGEFHSRHGRFYHMRPRLPYGVIHKGETLFVRGEGAEGRLCILYPKRKRRADIELDRLHLIGPHGLQADNDSQVDLVTTTLFRTGELVRDQDSITNIVTVDKYAYIFRKNVLRRFTFDPLLWGANMTGFRYGDKFAQSGSFIVNDGEGHFYLNNGHDQTLFKADLTRGKTFDPKDAPKVKDITVKTMKDLPIMPLKNSAFTWGGGHLWAVLDPKMGHAWAYTPKDNQWIKLPKFPRSKYPNATNQGCVIAWCNNALHVVRHDEHFKFTPAANNTWSKVIRIPFTVSQDGGMACFDEESNQLILAVGGARRDIAYLDLKKIRAVYLRKFFPDLVSVEGQRMWIAGQGPNRKLYIYRGHNSNELWRAPLPLPLPKEEAEK